MRIVFIVLSICVVGGLFLASAVQADSDNAAIVVKGGENDCVMPGADKDGNLIVGGTGNAETVVENNNKVMVKCKGENLTNDSGSGQSFRGFVCGVEFPSGGNGETEDSHATVSASGVGTLTCTYHKE
jgi:hypothetical protein